MLVTILAVSLVGILALSLFRTDVERQELVSMRANAGAVALQAEPLLWSMVQIGALRDLAETAAFLGGDQIRILGSDNRELADSTPGADAYVWLLPPLGFSLDEKDSGSIVVSLPTFIATETPPTCPPLEPNEVELEFDTVQQEDRGREQKVALWDFCAT